MKRTLYSYLINNYEPGEPIFYKDIIIGSSQDSLRHQFSYLVSNGKLAKYSNGIYFLPKKSLLGGKPFISTEAVVFSKYISRRNNAIGYYSGQTFANLIGVSYQVPVVKEIVTNECSANIRTIVLNNREYQIRKAKVHVTNENQIALQMLSFLENYKKYTDYEVPDFREKIQKYARESGLNRDLLFQYADKFNNSVFKTIVELGL